MVVVVRTDFLHQFVVQAVEVNIDADDLEGFRTEPRHVTEGLVLIAALRRVEPASRALLTFLHPLAFHSAVKHSGFHRAQNRLSCRPVEFHLFGGRNQTDRDVSSAARVVLEVDAEGPVAVIHDLPFDEQVEARRLHGALEISPAKHFLSFDVFRVMASSGLLAGRMCLC